MARKGAGQTRKFARILKSGLMGAAVWCVCGIAVGSIVSGLVLEWCHNDSEASMLMERHFAEFLFVWALKGCLSKGRSDAEGSQRRRQRDRRVRNRQTKRVHVPAIKVKWDSQERVQEPTAAHAPLSVVQSFGVGEGRLPGITKYRPRPLLKLSPQQSYNLLMVVKIGFKEWKCWNSCFETIQQRAFEQLAGFEMVEKIVFKVPFLVCPSSSLRFQR